MVSFDEKVWNLTAQIPKGKVTTYAELAHALNTKAYRAVGNALNRNPHGFWEDHKGQKTLSEIKRVPCHRVVASDGSVSGFALGTRKKIELLKKEGIDVSEGKIKDLDKKLFTF